MQGININSNEARAYLEGKKFSSGLFIFLKPFDDNFISRDEYLCKISQGKDVIHFGFVDHLPIITEKLKSDMWLHKKLIDTSNSCYGIDINKEGIEYLQNNLNIKNTFCIDIVKNDIPLEIKTKHFDYLLLPDVIEHTGNPVDFLRSIHLKFKTFVDNIIITTPNVFRFRNFKELIRGREFINTDHNFWFSPYTISKNISEAGFLIDRLNYTQQSFPHRNNIRNLLKNLFLAKYPWFKDNLIIEARFK